MLWTMSANFCFLAMGSTRTSHDAANRICGRQVLQLWRKGSFSGHRNNPILSDSEYTEIQTRRVEHPVGSLE